MCGYVPSAFDIELFRNIDSKSDLEKYPYVKRWWYHMRSFSDSEINLFPVISPSDLIINMFKDNEKTADEQVCDIQCNL